MCHKAILFCNSFKARLLQLFIFIYGSYSIAWFRLIDWIVVTPLHPSNPSFFSSSQAVFVRCCVGCLLASALDSALAWSVAPAPGSRRWCPARPDLGGCNGHQSDLMIQTFLNSETLLQWHVVWQFLVFFIVFFSIVCRFVHGTIHFQMCLLTLTLSNCTYCFPSTLKNH